MGVATPERENYFLSRPEPVEYGWNVPYRQWISVNVMVSRSSWRIALIC